MASRTKSEPQKKPSGKPMENDSRRSACFKHNSEDSERVKTSKKSKDAEARGSNEGGRREVESMVPILVDSEKGTESHITRDERKISTKDLIEDERKKGLFNLTNVVLNQAISQVFSHRKIVLLKRK